MTVLITGACGFVGSTLARAFADSHPHLHLLGFDNLVRRGSEQNRSVLQQLGVRVIHGDLRMASDLESLPAVDFVIDAAANPSVLAGVDGNTSARQLIEHNLIGTLNLLEYCRRQQAGFILLSTSRVYSISALTSIPVEVVDHAYRPSKMASGPAGISELGLNEGCSTAAPVSLYGATKLASETLALEYGETFGLPVFINRCGVLAGAGQFGRPDQGIYAYWVNSYLRRKPLKYIGFDGLGHQVRDCLHPRDLITLLLKQLARPDVPAIDRIVNCSGGIGSARSLRQLSNWCATRFGPHHVESELQSRPFDLPWLVLDPSKARRVWGWSPTTTTDEVLAEIADHAQTNPDWLDLSAGA